MFKDTLLLFMRKTITSYCIAQTIWYMSCETPIILTTRLEYCLECNIRCNVFLSPTLWIHGVYVCIYWDWLLSWRVSLNNESSLHLYFGTPFKGGVFFLSFFLLSILSFLFQLVHLYYLFFFCESNRNVFFKLILTFYVFLAYPTHLKLIKIQSSF